MKWQLSPPPIVAEILDGEAVILNLDEGTYYHLNPSGTLIWQMIEEGKGFQPPIAKEVETFLEELQAEKLIFEVEGEPAAFVQLPEEFPTLTRFDDMKDLLLLDPIHEVDQTGWPLKPN